MFQSLVDQGLGKVAPGVHQEFHDPEPTAKERRALAALLVAAADELTALLAAIVMGGGATVAADSITSGPPLTNESLRAALAAWYTAS